MVNWKETINIPHYKVRTDNERPKGVKTDNENTFMWNSIKKIKFSNDLF